jgi:hypothetical protein
MSETIVASSSPKKGRRWLRWLVWSAATLAVLLIIAYFAATSSAFLKGVVLPRAGAALNADITAGDAEFHPFSSLSLRDLTVTPHGQKPLLTASEIRVHYHLLDIIGGNIHVDEVALVSPKIELIQNPDGTGNLDPILKALQSGSTTNKPAPAPAASSGKPLKIDLGKLTVSDAAVFQIKNYADGRHDAAGVTNINVSLTNLKNGQTAKLDLSADILVDNQSTNSAGRLAAAAKGSFTCALTPDLKPDSATGNLNFTVSQAGGAFSDFDGFSTALDCDMTPTNIKQLALHFQKSGAPLGELTVSGPFDAGKQEGKLSVAIHGIDHRLLDLAAAKTGLDFGTTTIDATNEIQLANGGASISVAGRLDAAHVRLTRASQATPTLDLAAAYNVTLDRAKQTATVRALDLTGRQNGAALLGAQLTSPMSVAWGTGAAGDLGDASLELDVTGLNLPDWKPFLGDTVQAGKVDVKLKVLSRQGGREIGFDLNSAVAGLGARAGSNSLSQAGITLTARGRATQFKQVAVSDYALNVTLQNQPALSVAGSASYDTGTGDADAQVKLQVAVARCLQAFPQPGVSFSSGDVTLNAQVTQKQKTQAVTGDLTLANLSGQSGKTVFQNFGTQIKLDVANSPAQIQVKQMTGSFSQNGRVGGGFDITATYQPAQQSAQAEVKLVGLNESGLRPFLEPALAGKTLTSVSINGTISAKYDPHAASSVKADIKVANLVVNDPTHQFPATPLAVGLAADASLDGQVADVRQLQIGLTPTARATNQVNFSGRVDFSKAAAIQGNLKLAADSLDLTSYYDLFAGGAKATNKPAAAPAPASATASASQEPAAVKLPLHDFTFAANIGRLYLHEVAISNLVTTVKLDGGHVVVNPFQLGLNGAPVNATVDADLSVPGYKYNVSYKAQKIPLTPLVNTFAPQMSGQLGGTLTSDAQITGAGVGGANLKKNLAGTFNLDTTNLNLSVVNVKSSVLKGIINVVATIPELLSNPVNAISSLLGGVTGQGGLMNDLKQAPIESITAQVTVGSGQVTLKSSRVQSTAFLAEATGGIALNAVLTNSSINIPVTVSLSQALAQKMNLASGGTSTTTTAAYVPLPQFLTMTGTLGNAKPKIDRLALVGITARSIGGAGLLQNVATNVAPLGNMLKGFLPSK